MKDYDSSSFIEQLKTTLNLKYLRKVRKDDNKPLYNGANLSCKEFNDKFRSLIAHADLTEDMTDKLRDLFISSLPEDSLFQKGSQMEQYYEKPIVFNFHCCLCANTVYEGNNIGSFKCNFCPLYRYTDKSNRYPIAFINYRPITAIICELLETDAFLVAIHMRNKDIKGKGIYSDITASKYCKELLTEMHNQYILKKNRGDFENSNPIEVNLLLGLSYDGAQIYRHATSDFYPMFISILSLPPELRKTLGKGTFMISLYTFKQSTIAEEFLFHKCLVDELLLLNNGISMQIKNKKYHIQARLCIIGVDSKALETLTYTQGTNSHVGCPLCRLSPG